MTYKQRLKKARELLAEDRRTEAARQIVTALRKKKDLTKQEIADELGTSKGWVRDFLGQHRYVDVEPIKDPPRKKKKPAKKKPAKKKTSKKPARKKSAAEKAVTKTVKATVKKATSSKPFSPSKSSSSSSKSSGQKKS